MIQSMTGFGKSNLSFSDKKITVQLKSLNSKKLDIYSRIPTEYRELELHFQKAISATLERGKVDFTLSVENLFGETATQINAAAVKKYMEDLKSITTENPAEVELLKMAISLPDSLQNTEVKITKEEVKALDNALEEALHRLVEYRKDEGRALEADFKLRIQNITNSLKEVEDMDADRIKETRERLRQAVSDLKEEIDENRFEQELIYYLEKYDITEEKTRLSNHLSYFTETLNSSESNGRKLGFISQEMGREINTIGSKSNHAPMQKCVVEMKDELEKIKEQLLNIL